MMTENEQRERVVAVAEEWIGTPFHDCAGVKGVGVDCAHLLERVYSEAGVMESLPIDQYSPDWYLHRSEELFISYILKRGHEIEEAQVKPGDMAIFKVGRCFSHGSIIAAWPDRLIHAMKQFGMVLETRLEEYDLGSADVKFFSLWGDAR